MWLPATELTSLPTIPPTCTIFKFTVVIDRTRKSLKPGSNSFQGLEHSQAYAAWLEAMARTWEGITDRRRQYLQITSRGSEVFHSIEMTTT